MTLPLASPFCVLNRREIGSWFMMNDSWQEVLDARLSYAHPLLKGKCIVCRTWCIDKVLRALYLSGGWGNFIAQKK